jgi:hypothetical protein
MSRLVTTSHLYTCYGTLTLVLSVKDGSRKSVRYHKGKWLTREGEENREKIFDFINENENGPVSVDEIFRFFKSDENKLSKRTIHDHIKKLLQQKRIWRNEKDKTYVTADHDFGYITTFAKMMRDALGLMISPHLMNPESLARESCLPPESIGTIDSPELRSNFWNNISGRSVPRSSLKPRNTNGNDNTNELYLLEFANRIGAYITYLFIESMRPIDYNSIEKNEELQSLRRDMLSRSLLSIAIDLRRMFRLFHGLLYSTDQIKKEYPAEHVFFELDKADYEKVVKTFKKVYPKIYKGLEGYWKDINNDLLLQTLDLKEAITRKKIDCKHTWKKVKIFKLEGNYYHCRKCNNVVTEYQLNR